MEFILIILGITAVIVLYFCFGICIKFLWGWLPLVFGLLVGLIIAIFGGIWGAIIGGILIICAIFYTNEWQGTNLYLNIEEKIEKAFYFKD